MTQYTTLIDCSTLNKHLNHSDWAVVDCRFNLMDTEAGRRAYQESHIPGARYAHLDEDLSSPITADSGRHPLPEPSALATTLGHWGIDLSTQVVVYDDAGGGVAARLWWLMRWLGSTRCAVLDGGWPAWQTQGYPVTQERPQATVKQFPDHHNDRLWLDTAAVSANTKSKDRLLFDARSESRFRGEQEPIDPVAGHVPGALSMPLTDNLKNGHFLSAELLRQRFEPHLSGRTSDQVVHMCGSGVTACHNLLAMEIAGLNGSLLYPGSWSEWIRDPARPIAKVEDF